MARAFRRKGAAVVGRLDALERAVLVDLLTQTRELLASHQPQPTGDVFTDLVSSIGIPALDDAARPPDMGDEQGAPAEIPGPPAAAVPPTDPALARLLPDANRTDPEAAAEFRRLTEQGLRERKSENLGNAIDLLERVVVGRRKEDTVRLDLGEAQAFVVALTDVRLVLGERLGLRDDGDADRLSELLGAAPAPDDPRTALAAYYEFTTWLQEGLTQALLR